MPDLQREQGMNAAHRDRGGGRGILFAGVFLQMGAVQLLPPSRDVPHRSLRLKAKIPKYPSRAVCCLPSHGHTCGGPAWILFVTIPRLSGHCHHTPGDVEIL